jgi:hypothetical protein
VNCVGTCVHTLAEVPALPPLPFALAIAVAPPESEPKPSALRPPQLTTRTSHTAHVSRVARSMSRILHTALVPRKSIHAPSYANVAACRSSPRVIFAAAKSCLNLL